MEGRDPRGQRAVLSYHLNLECRARLVANKHEQLLAASLKISESLWFGRTQESRGESRFSGGSALAPHSLSLAGQLGISYIRQVTKP